MKHGLDHTKKYTVIDGCLIEMSFSEKPNESLFERINGILLGSGLHVCGFSENAVQSETDKNGEVQK